MALNRDEIARNLFMWDQADHSIDMLRAMNHWDNGIVSPTSYAKYRDRAAILLGESVRANDKRYTVEEIDEMRLELRRIPMPDWQHHGSSWPNPEIVEAQLRTYMANGTRPAELKARADLYWSKWATT